MNKKTYITPDMQIVRIDCQHVITAGSDQTLYSEQSVSDGDSDFVQYSRSFGLWDDEEE